jgi:hypothetical protein
MSHLVQHEPKPKGPTSNAKIWRTRIETSIFYLFSHQFSSAARPPFGQMGESFMVCRLSFGSMTTRMAIACNWPFISNPPSQWTLLGIIRLLTQSVPLRVGTWLLLPSWDTVWDDWCKLKLSRRKNRFVPPRHIHTTYYARFVRRHHLGIENWWNPFRWTIEYVEYPWRTMKRVRMTPRRRHPFS